MPNSILLKYQEIGELVMSEGFDFYILINGMVCVCVKNNIYKLRTISSCDILRM